MKYFLILCLSMLVISMMGCTTALQPCGSRGSSSKVEANIILKDVATGGETQFKEVLDAKVAAPDSSIRPKGRTQTCHEVCSKSCYGTKPGSGDWACYWTCRWYCKPAAGGDPRSQQVKNINVVIETDTSKLPKDKSKSDVKGSVVVKDTATGKEAVFKDVLAVPLPCSIKAHIPQNSQLRAISILIEIGPV